MPSCDRELRRALLLNACFSLASGLALALASEPLGEWLGVGDTATLAWIGYTLVAFAGHLFWSRSRGPTRVELAYFVISDSLWVLGTAGILVLNPAILAPPGRWVALAVAVLVGALAYGQWRGLVRMSPDL